MKHIILILYLLFGVIVYSQQDQKFISKATYRLDSIHIHWVPVSIENYEHIYSENIQVEIIPWNSDRKPIATDFINFPSKEIFTVFSRKSIIENDSSVLSPKSLLLMNGVLFSDDTLASKMVYANSMLMSSIDRDLSKEMGLYLSLKTKFDSDYIAYRLKFSGAQEFGQCQNKFNAPMVRFDSLSYQNESGEITLKWNQEELKYHFSAYEIERSQNRKDFNKLNQTPYIHFVTEHEGGNKPAMFVDKEIVQGETYFYRIKAIDHLGFVSGLSNLVRVTVPKPIDGYLSIDSIHFDKSIYVKGNLISDPSEISNVKKFNLHYSTNITRDYKLLSSSNPKDLEPLFRINQVDVAERGYFKLSAISKSDDTLYSEPKYYFFRDSIPPSQVSELKGEVDTVGRVSLKWSRVDDDLIGYRLFRANSLKEEFVEQTKEFIKDTFYLDSISLHNLTKDIYYKVVAVDLNFNNSKFSDPVKLIKPDLIAPVPSYISNSSISGDGVLLNWISSNSKDVASSFIQKQDSIHFINVYKTDKDRFFLDPNVQNGQSYKYRMMTMDSSGNKSFSKIIKVEYELGYRKSLENLEYELSREENYIKLLWENPKDLYSINIYMAKNENAFYLVKSLFKNESEFMFTRLPINNKYKFKVQIMYKDGSMSKMSDKLTVEY
jgi:hypothetical protein